MTVMTLGHSRLHACKQMGFQKNKQTWIHSFKGQQRGQNLNRLPSSQLNNTLCNPLQMTHGESFSQCVTKNHRNPKRSKFSFYFPVNVFYLLEISMNEDMKLSQENRGEKKLWMHYWAGVAVVQRLGIKLLNHNLVSSWVSLLSCGIWDMQACRPVLTVDTSLSFIHDWSN